MTHTPHDAALDAMNTREKELVTRLGEAIGFGRTMQLCEEIWKERSIAQNLTGSEHTVGPCGAFMVPCPHAERDDNGHCEWCCGAGRVTKRVAAAQTALQQQEAGWLDISTAPKDGRTVLVFDSYIKTREGRQVGADGYSVITARFNIDKWEIHCRNGNYIYCVNPTHWQSLPAPPSASSSPEREPIKIVGIECYELTAEEKIILENFKVAQRNSIEELVATYPGLKGKL